MAPGMQLIASLSLFILFILAFSKDNASEILRGLDLLTNGVSVYFPPWLGAIMGLGTGFLLSLIPYMKGKPRKTLFLSLFIILLTFLFLLPVWGFFTGFLLGVQTIDYLFDVGLLATVTGWVVGFFVGLMFAVLAYLYYLLAVGIVSFGLGYGVTIGILAWIGLDPGFLMWLIAMAVGLGLAYVVYRFNIQKYAIIVATAVGGTGLIIYTFLVLFDNTIAVLLLENPVKLAIDDSFWWLLFFLVVAGLAR